MGLREMALVLIAVIFETACTDCKPQALTENPFARYVGKKYGKSVVNSDLIKSQNNHFTSGEPFTNLDIYKNYDFPENGFLPSKTVLANKKFDPALLDSYKKEARRKRKSKKQNDKYVAPKETDLIDTQPLLISMGTFPEVEYPLNAMDIWVPKYWNMLPYNTDNILTKQNNVMLQTQPINTQTYKCLPKVKGKTAAFAKKPQQENKNKEFNALKPNNEKNGKIIAPLISETKVRNDISKVVSNVHSSPGRQVRRRPYKRMKTPGLQRKLNQNRKTLAKSKAGNIFTIVSNDSYNSTLTCSQNSSNNSTPSCVTKISNKSMDNNSITSEFASEDNNQDILVNLISSLTSSNIDKFNNLDSAQTKLISGECPSDVICESQTYNKVPVTISSVVTHEAMIDPHIDSEIEVPVYKTDSYDIENYAYTNRSHAHLSKLTKLYNLVESVLTQLSLQENNIHIPNHILAKIISDIEALPTNYTLQNSSNTDKTLNLSTVTPIEYIPGTIKMNNISKSDKLITNEQTTSVPENSSEKSLSLNNGQNDLISVCPLPAIDQCSMYNKPNSDNTSTNMTSLTTLVELLNVSTFERMIEYPKLEEKSADNKSLYDLESFNLENPQTYAVSEITDKEMASKFRLEERHSAEMTEISKEYALTNIPANNTLADKSNKTMSKALEANLLDKKFEYDDCYVFVDKADTNISPEIETLPNTDTSQDISSMEELTELFDNFILTQHETPIIAVVQDDIPVFDIASNTRLFSDTNVHTEPLSANNILASPHAVVLSEETYAIENVSVSNDSNILPKTKLSPENRLVSAIQPETFTNDSMPEMSEADVLADPHATNRILEIPDADFFPDSLASDRISEISKTDIFLNTLITDSIPDISDTDASRDTGTTDILEISDANVLLENNAINKTSDLPNASISPEKVLTDKIAEMTDDVPPDTVATDIISEMPEAEVLLSANNSDNMLALLGL